MGSTGPKCPYDGCDESHGSLCRGHLEQFRTRGASEPSRYALGGYGSHCEHHRARLEVSHSPARPLR
jgi:hypothetical protein